MSDGGRFREIKHRTVAEDAALALRRMIARGQLKPGDKLPGERRLAEMLGVSRVSLRDALEMIRQHGDVVTDNKRGTWVAPMPSAEQP